MKIFQTLRILFSVTAQQLSLNKCAINIVNRPTFISISIMDATTNTLRQQGQVTELFISKFRMLKYNTTIENAIEVFQFLDVEFAWRIGQLSNSNMWSFSLSSLILFCSWQLMTSSLSSLPLRPRQ